MDRTARFDELFDAHHHRVLAYLARRVDQPADAADLLAEVFLVAWRRLDSIPEAQGIWLLGVARKVLANYRRGNARRHQLADRLREEISTELSPRRPPGVLGAALQALRPADRELITLTNWDGLSPTEVAALLGLSPETTRVRLHRARARLKALVDHENAAGVRQEAPAIG